MKPWNEALRMAGYEKGIKILALKTKEQRDAATKKQLEMWMNRESKRKISKNDYHSFAAGLLDALDSGYDPKYFAERVNVDWKGKKVPRSYPLNMK